MFKGNLGPVHTNPFSNENGAVFSVFKKISVHLIVFVSFLYVHTSTPYLFENAVIPSVRMVKWTRRMRISIYRPAKLARNWSYMVAPVRHCGYSRSSGFDDVTVFKKHRFQIAPLWRAFSNGSVFGDRFRRCSVDDSRIRSKTAPFSFENGSVWTGPKWQSFTYFGERLGPFTQIFVVATRCNFCRPKVASSFKHVRNSCDIAATNRNENRTWFTRAILKLQL